MAGRVSYTYPDCTPVVFDEEVKQADPNYLGLGFFFGLLVGAVVAAVITLVLLTRFRRREIEQRRLSNKYGTPGTPLPLTETKKGSKKAQKAKLVATHLSSLAVCQDSLFTTLASSSRPVVLQKVKAIELAEIDRLHEKVQQVYCSTLVSFLRESVSKDEFDDTKVDQFIHEVLHILEENRGNTYTALTPQPKDVEDAYEVFLYRQGMPELQIRSHLCKLRERLRDIEHELSRQAVSLTQKLSAHQLFRAVNVERYVVGVSDNLEKMKQLQTFYTAQETENPSLGQTVKRVVTVLRQASTPDAADFEIVKTKLMTQRQNKMRKIQKKSKLERDGCSRNSNWQEVYGLLADQLGEELDECHESDKKEVEALQQYLKTTFADTISTVEGEMDSSGDRAVSSTILTQQKIKILEMEKAALIERNNLNNQLQALSEENQGAQARLEEQVEHVIQGFRAEHERIVEAIIQSKAAFSKESSKVISYELQRNAISMKDQARGRIMRHITALQLKVQEAGAKRKKEQQSPEQTANLRMVEQQTFEGSLISELHSVHSANAQLLVSLLAKLECSELRMLHKTGELPENLALEFSREIASRVNPRVNGKYAESAIEDCYADMADTLDQQLDFKDQKLVAVNRLIARGQPSRGQDGFSEKEAAESELEKLRKIEAVNAEFEKSLVKTLAEQQKQFLARIAVSSQISAKEITQMSKKLCTVYKDDDAKVLRKFSKQLKEEMSAVR